MFPKTLIYSMPHIKISLFTFREEQFYLLDIAAIDFFGIARYVVLGLPGNKGRLIQTQ